MSACHKCTWEPNKKKGVAERSIVRNKRQEINWHDCSPSIQFEVRSERQREERQGDSQPLKRLLINNSYKILGDFGFYRFLSFIFIYFCLFFSFRFENLRHIKLELVRKIYIHKVVLILESDRPDIPLTESQSCKYSEERRASNTR